LHLLDSRKSNVRSASILTWQLATRTGSMPEQRQLDIHRSIKDVRPKAFSGMTRMCLRFWPFDEPVSTVNQRPGGMGPWPSSLAPRRPRLKPK
jgi:hypothetical protein